MAIEQACCAVTASSTNGAQTVKAQYNVAQVNRTAAGTFAVHLTDSLVSVQPFVKICTNAGSATERYYGYDIVSARQINVFILDSSGAGADVDFSVSIESDSDGSAGH